jgi:hypothetical protein
MFTIIMASPHIGDLSLRRDGCGRYGSRNYLEASHQHKNQDHNHDQTQPTGWKIAPTPAVAPCWKGADQDQNQYY